MMKVAIVLRSIPKDCVAKLIGRKLPKNNLYLLSLLKQSNPALFTDSTNSLGKSAHLSNNTLHSLLHNVDYLEDFLRSALDYLLTFNDDIDELLLVVKKYQQMFHKNPQICYLHDDFISTVQTEALQFLRKYPDYTASQNGFRKSLVLAVDLFKFSPPHCREYMTQLQNNLPYYVTKEDFLAFLFTISLSRRLNSPAKRWVIKHFLQLVDSMSVDNICFLTSALYKSEISVNSEVILDKIVAKTLNNLQLLNPLSFSCIVNGLKFVKPSPNEDFFVALWKHLDNSPQPSFINCLHLNELAKYRLCYLEELNERLLVAINKNFAYFSLDNVVQIISQAVLFEHGRPNYHLIKEIVHQIKDDKKLLNMQDKLVDLTRSLCALDIHVPEFIDEVLSIDWQGLYNSPGRIKKSVLIDLMLIRDYCMIEQYPHYEFCLTNLDQMYKIFSEHPAFRLEMVKFFNKRRFMDEIDVNFIKTFGPLADYLRRKYPNSHLWKGYLLSSATKPSLILYDIDDDDDNSNLKNILESCPRQPSSLKGCISFEITSEDDYTFKDRSLLEPKIRLRRRALNKLGIKTIEILSFEVNLRQSDPFKFILPQIQSILDQEKELKKKEKN